MQHGAGQLVVVGQVDAVGNQPLVRGEPLQPAGCTVVDSAFAHVDVDPNIQVGSQAGRRLEGLVAAGEGRVDTDPSAAASPEESSVLVEAAAGAVHAMPIGHAIGGQDPNADFLTGCDDDIE